MFRVRKRYKLIQLVFAALLLSLSPRLALAKKSHLPQGLVWAGKVSLPWSEPKALAGGTVPQSVSSLSFPFIINTETARTKAYSLTHHYHFEHDREGVVGAVEIRPTEDAENGKKMMQLILSYPDVRAAPQRDCERPINSPIGAYCVVDVELQDNVRYDVRLHNVGNHLWTADLYNTASHKRITIGSYRLSSAEGNLVLKGDADIDYYVGNPESTISTCQSLPMLSAALGPVYSEDRGGVVVTLNKAEEETINNKGDAMCHSPENVFVSKPEKFDIKIGSKTYSEEGRHVVRGRQFEPIAFSAANSSLKIEPSHNADCVNLVLDPKTADKKSILNADLRFSFSSLKIGTEFSYKDYLYPLAGKAGRYSTELCRVSADKPHEYKILLDGKDTKLHITYPKPMHKGHFRVGVVEFSSKAPKMLSGGPVPQEVSQLTFPFIIKRTWPLNAYSLEQDYGFDDKGREVPGVVGMQPAADGSSGFNKTKLEAFFAVRDPQALPAGSTCHFISNSGGGVRCAITFDAGHLSYDSRYDIKVHEAGEHIWAAELTDMKTGKQLHIGSYKLPKSTSGLLISGENKLIVSGGSLSYYAGDPASTISSCQSLPMINASVGPIYSEDNGGIVIPMESAFEDDSVNMGPVCNTEQSGFTWESEKFNIKINSKTYSEAGLSLRKGWEPFPIELSEKDSSLKIEPGTNRECTELAFYPKDIKKQPIRNADLRFSFIANRFGGAAPKQGYLYPLNEVPGRYATEICGREKEAPAVYKILLDNASTNFQVTYPKIEPEHKTLAGDLSFNWGPARQVEGKPVPKFVNELIFPFIINPDDTMPGKGYSILQEYHLEAPNHDIIGTLGIEPIGWDKVRKMMKVRAVFGSADPYIAPSSDGACGMNGNTAGDGVHCETYFDIDPNTKYDILLFKNSGTLWEAQIINTKTGEERHIGSYRAPDSTVILPEGRGYIIYSGGNPSGTVENCQNLPVVSASLGPVYSDDSSGVVIPMGPPKEAESGGDLPVCSAPASGFEWEKTPFDAWINQKAYKADGFRFIRGFVHEPLK